MQPMKKGQSYSTITDKNKKHPLIRSLKTQKNLLKNS